MSSLHSSHLSEPVISISNLVKAYGQSARLMGSTLRSSPVKSMVF